MWIDLANDLDKLDRMLEDLNNPSPESDQGKSPLFASS